MDFITFGFLIFAALLITACLLTIWWFGGMLLPIIAGGGPYVPTSPDRVERMIRLAKIESTDHVADIGSGDGRLLIAAIEAGAKSAIGYEIHPGLVKYSRRKIRKKNLKDKIKILKESFWDADLSQFDVILMYQIPYAMKKIGRKLRNELPHGARVVSNGFKFPDWDYLEEEADIYLYRNE